MHGNTQGDIPGAIKKTKRCACKSKTTALNNTMAPQHESHGLSAYFNQPKMIAAGHISNIICTTDNSLKTDQSLSLLDTVFDICF